MSRLLGLAIIAVLIYFALTQGMPWLKTAMGSGGGGEGGGGDSSYCVAQANAANDAISNELIPNARPPVDSGVWGNALLRVAGKLAAAENACSCPTGACAKGTDAIYEMRTMFDEFDDIAHGNPMGISNPARRQERVFELLNQARDLARSE